MAGMSGDTHFAKAISPEADTTRRYGRERLGYYW